jgi:hypothetical protein
MLKEYGILAYTTPGIRHPTVLYFSPSRFLAWYNVSRIKYDKTHRSIHTKAAFACVSSGVGNFVKSYMSLRVLEGWGLVEETNN